MKNTTPPPASALIVDPQQESLQSITRVLREEGLGCQPFLTTEEACATLSRTLPDLALIGLAPNDEGSFELVRDLKARGVAPILGIADREAMDAAVRAMKSGASDMLPRPMDVARLRILAREALANREERVHPAARPEESIVGDSSVFRAMLRALERVAATHATVLLRGETGCGKEVLARAIHDRSDRSSEPFVALNCGGIQASLIESELFGHERGAFTGANRRHHGVFERASTGTLFLDEVTEMPKDLQVRLLRVLETGELVRVGGSETIRTGARIVAATNRDPEQAVDEGHLRPDLYFRLAVFPVHVPPLRERGDDVTLLADHFLAESNRAYGSSVVLTDSAHLSLREHEWPGNVRELRNCIERATILKAPRGEIGSSDLFTGPKGTPSTPEGRGFEPGQSIASVERQLILETMHELGGDKREAARLLGISLKTLYNRLNGYGLGRYKEWGLRRP